MIRLYLFIISIIFLSGCSFHIQPGKYTTATPAFAGKTLIITENGRFQYSEWTDDGLPSKGHGGYIVLNKKMFLFFENRKEFKNMHSLTEIGCAKQDTQVVNFIIKNCKSEPLIAVNIIDSQDDTHGTTSQIDGIGVMSFPKSNITRSIDLYYIMHETLNIEFEGDKCYDIDVRMIEKIDYLKLGDYKIISLKKEDDKLFFKIPSWRNYQEFFLEDEY